MKKTLTCAVATMVLATVFAQSGFAQMTSERDHWATFSIDFGGFSPMTTLEDDTFGESSFESGFAVGFSAAGWITDHFGVRAKIVRSKTDGTNETSEFAPIAVNDPNQWSWTVEATGRLPIEGDRFTMYPYIALGTGIRTYNWAESRNTEDRFLSLTGAVGLEIQPAFMGPFGFVGELRGYRSQFDAFGINGGNWRPGTLAREGTDIGFYGGVVDKVWTNDMLFTLGLTYSY